MAIHPASTRQAIVNVNASGDNSIIAASGTGSVIVYAILFTVSGATNITFKSGATVLSGPIMLTGAGSSLSLVQSENPWFTCNLGDNFIVNSSNAVQVSGMVYYTT